MANVIHAAAEALDTSLAVLRETLALFDKDEMDAIRERVFTDAIIKEFEVAFGYAWKLMKAAAEYEGAEAPGPRPAIQEAQRFGWIEDPDFWAEALDARNGSVRDYFGISMNAYMGIVRRFVSESNALIGRIEKARAPAARASRKIRRR